MNFRGEFYKNLTFSVLLKEKVSKSTECKSAVRNEEYMVIVLSDG